MNTIETIVQLAPPDAEAAARAALALMDDPAFTELGTEVSTRRRHAIDAVSNSSQARAASLIGEA